MLCLMLVGLLFIKSLYAQTLNTSGTQFDFVFPQNRILPPGDITKNNHSAIRSLIHVTNTDNVNAAEIDIDLSGFTTGLSLEDLAGNPHAFGSSGNIPVPAGGTIVLEVIGAVFDTIKDTTGYIQTLDIRPFTMLYNGIRQNKMFTLTADIPVNVYIESLQEFSRDITTVIPTVSLGQQYYVSTVQGNTLTLPQGCGTNGRNCTGGAQINGGPAEFSIVATDPGITGVDITFPAGLTVTSNIGDPASYTGLDRLANCATTATVNSFVNSITIQLNQGEAIQFQADGIDLSGTFVRATSGETNNFAVFAGNFAGRIADPTIAATDNFDFILEQMLPVEAWGFSYASVPLTQPNAALMDHFEVIASQPGTIEVHDGMVTNPLVLTASAAGDHFVLDNVTAGALDLNRPLFFCSSIPFGVTQYTRSNEGTNPLNYIHAGPSFTALIPLNQRISEAVVSVPTATISVGGINNTKRDRITVITPTVNTGNISVLHSSGVTPSTTNPNWTAIGPNGNCGGIGYSYQIYNVNNNSLVDADRYTITDTGALNCNGGFISYSYGYDLAEGYSFYSGASLQDEAPEIIEFLDQSVCQQDLQIDITSTVVGGTPPLNYTWQIDDGASIAVINNNGPTAPFFGPLPGLYSVTLTVTDPITGCFDEDIKTITVFEHPTVTLLDDAAVCVGNVETLTASAVGGTIPYAGAFNWSVDPTTGATITPALAFPSATADFLATVPGSYTVTVSRIDFNGCLGSDEVVIDVVSPPSISIEDKNICDLYLPFELDVNADLSNVVGPFTYQWSVTPSSATITPSGSATTVTSIPYTEFNSPNHGPHTVTLTVIDQFGCLVTEVFEILVEDCCPAKELFDLEDQILSDITFFQTQIWEGQMYIDDGVTVTIDGLNNPAGGVVLDVTNVDIVFGECAGINFVNGGRLRANNSVFRPCDESDSWRGLYFEESYDNRINECTFKNAQIALDYNNSTTGTGQQTSIANNLFLNCLVGVFNQNVFNQPIVGNTFTCDEVEIDFSPDNCVAERFSVNNMAAFNRAGIISTSMDFSGDIRQNRFVGSGIGDGTLFTAIEFVSGAHDVTISENTFTDNLQALTFSDNGSIDVLNNDFELTQEFVNTTANSVPQVGLERNEDIWIAGNTFSGPESDWNNDPNFTTWIFENDGFGHLEIEGNLFRGLDVAIMSSNPATLEIVDNQILNVNLFGVAIATVDPDGDPMSVQVQNIDIACNVINLRSADIAVGPGSQPAVGIAYTNALFGNPEFNIEDFFVRSNCIFEARRAMYFDNLVNAFAVNTTASLPRIRNNYLYNYQQSGIDNLNFVVGDIGTDIFGPDVAGKNTFISNNQANFAAVNNGGADVRSTDNLVVAGNFGIQTITTTIDFQGVGDEFNSTASCGTQIGGAVNRELFELGFDEICEWGAGVVTTGFPIPTRDDELETEPLAGGSFKLMEENNGQISVNPLYGNYLNTISENLREREASLILSSLLRNEDLTNANTFYQEVLQLGILPSTDWLTYEYHLGTKEYALAAEVLASISPQGLVERMRKNVESFKLSVLLDGRTFVQLSSSDIAFLMDVANGSTPYSGYAKGLLNINGHSLNRTEPKLPELRDFSAQPDKTIIDVDKLEVWPNPAANEITVKYFLSNSDKAQLNVHNLLGELVWQKDLTYSATQLNVDLSTWPAGLYFVSTINADGVSQVVKLIKE